MTRPDRVLACLALASVLSGCQPELVVSQDEPIVIQVDITHEVRITLDESVQELMRREAVTNRGDATERGADLAAVTALKAAGEVGEAASGYLEWVPEGKQEGTAGPVQRLNLQRRTEYGTLAERLGTTLEIVETVAGARRIRDAVPGERVRFSDGTWTTR